MIDETFLHTTGRRMTESLADALDNLTSRDRRHAIIALQESEGPLADVFAALAVELRVCELREEHVMHQTQADFYAGAADDLPAPPSNGPALLFDPESRKFSPMPGDVEPDGL